MPDLSVKKRQNRRYALTEKQLLEWDHIFCIVHNKNLVMRSRIGRNGKKVKYLDWK